MQLEFPKAYHKITPSGKVDVAWGMEALKGLEFPFNIFATAALSSQR